MGALAQFIGDWSHVLCAALFAVLTIWTSRHFATLMIGKLLVAAFSITAIWALSIAFGGVDRLESGVMESLRNCAWLVCLFMSSRLGLSEARHERGAMPLYAMLLLLLVAQSGLDIAAMMQEADGRALGPLAEVAVVLRVLWGIGALLLIQRIYVSSPAHTRAISGPIAAVMAAMWSYDLLLYGAAFFKAQGPVFILFAARGLIMASLAPIIAIALRNQGNQEFKPSRSLAWRGIGAALALLGMLLTLLVLLMIDSIATPMVSALTTGLVFVVVVGALVGLPSTRLHAQIKVLIAKHLFRHRYDYREQWMAFADTIGSGAHMPGAHIEQRAIKAMADITDSPAGLLLMQDASGGFVYQSAWNWPVSDEPASHEKAYRLPAAIIQRMEEECWIIDIADEKAAGSSLPDWLFQEPLSWALVPIFHFGDLIAVLVLARPPVMRSLDWEDFDMLRAAGKQVASTLAEAQGQAALAEARRFEEFNRRFAFIMHDIKNLVSQIALVARNAERHADNPEFRQDMVLTLKEAADKMNMMLARLSQHNSSSDVEATDFALGDVAHAVVASRKAAHPLLVEGDLAVPVMADRAKVEQILTHLVQNAIEASGGDAPVVLRLDRQDGAGRIAVMDYGSGMSAEFIRDELFRPFASTKEGGFGIGAYEARELVLTMDGALTVESTPGKGSIFTVSLPLADTVGSAGPAKERAA